MIALNADIEIEDLMNIFMNFFEDEHVNVRMQGVENCLSFAKKGISMNDYVKRYAADESWRIRFLVADKLKEIADALCNGKARISSSEDDKISKAVKSTWEVYDRDNFDKDNAKKFV